MFAALIDCSKLSFASGTLLLHSQWTSNQRSRTFCVVIKHCGVDSMNERLLTVLVILSRIYAMFKKRCCYLQVETGSAITWKYPSVVLKGDNSVGEFYSVALTNNKQQADTGTKMVHVGKNTRSRIVSKGISAGNSVNAYRGLVQVRCRAALFVLCRLHCYVCAAVHVFTIVIFCKLLD
jgi:hypothetical protein